MGSTYIKSRKMEDKFSLLLEKQFRIILSSLLLSIKLFPRSLPRVEARLRAAAGLGAAGNQNLVRSHTFKQKHTSRWYEKHYYLNPYANELLCPLRRRGESDARVKVRVCVSTRVKLTQTPSKRVYHIYFMDGDADEWEGDREERANQSHSKK